MSSPPVSVICLCHNQAGYVEEAIGSVLNQTYDRIELIVVDDGSTDGSKQKIKEMRQKLDFQFIDITHAIGNCRAFNQGFKLAKGHFVIDLAADDMLLPTRIEKGIRTFSKKKIGVEFCNVMNVDQNGTELKAHFTNGPIIPEGDIYLNLISSYFISPPGMMIKKEVLDALEGYDEHLTYEDFDFWIRSSRDYHYGYTNEVLVQKRDVPDSLSKKQFKWLSKHQKSTLAVCIKIEKLNRTQHEFAALRRRCLYEIKNCLMQGNLLLIPGFLRLVFSYPQKPAQ